MSALDRARPTGARGLRLWDEYGGKTRQLPPTNTVGAAQYKLRIPSKWSRLGSPGGPEARSESCGYKREVRATARFSVHHSVESGKPSVQ